MEEMVLRLKLSELAGKIAGCRDEEERDPPGRRIPADAEENKRLLSSMGVRGTGLLTPFKTAPPKGCQQPRPLDNLPLTTSMDSLQGSRDYLAWFGRENVLILVLMLVLACYN